MYYGSSLWRKSIRNLPNGPGRAGGSDQAVRGGGWEERERNKGIQRHNSHRGWQAGTHPPLPRPYIQKSPQSSDTPCSLKIQRRSYSGAVNRARRISLFSCLPCLSSAAATPRPSVHRRDAAQTGEQRTAFQSSAHCLPSVVTTATGSNTGGSCLQPFVPIQLYWRRAPHYSESTGGCF